jgi:hypothetical protein
LKILIMAGHWGLRSDSRDKRGFTAVKLMRGRGDANPELQKAFASLLRAVHGTPTKIEKERMMEAGLEVRRDPMWFDESKFGRAAMSEENGQVDNVSEDGSEKFEDAVENL